MDLLLKDKVILTTGSSQGLGLACAKMLCEENATVIISSRNGTNLKNSVGQIRESTGIEPSFYVADVSKQKDIILLKQSIEEDFGKIDGLLINAGGPSQGKSLEFNEEEWNHAINTNFLSVVRLTKSFVPMMRKNSYGRIVAITSISAKQPLSNLGLSNSTRLGVIGYLKTLSNEIASEDILVNSVLPGLTKTMRLKKVMESWADLEGTTVDAMEKLRSKDIPIGRLGRPEELASIVCYLISGKNTYITGQAIAVDGGYIKSAL